MFGRFGFMVFGGYMNKSTVSICGIKIQVESSEPLDDPMFQSFNTQDITEPDILVNVYDKESIEVPKGQVVIDEVFKWTKLEGPENGWSIYFNEEVTGTVLYRMDVNSSWDKAVVYCNSKIMSPLSAFTGPMGEVLFRNHILFRKGMVIHASAIAWEDKGILFSAPSGTGKTTQANLWKQHYNARELNGDRPAMRLIDGQPWVFGSPWSGGRPVYLNESAPIKAIVLLEQAPENKVRELSPIESLPRIMPRCFLPYYDKELMKIALDNLEKIVLNTSIYLLQCRPDREAVELIKQCVK